MIIEATLIDPSLSPSKWSNLMGSLPEPIRKSASKYRFQKDQQLHVAGRLLLFRALKGLGYHWDQIHSCMEFDAFRRPFFKDIPGDFNISHSGNLVICAVNREGCIGADVEQIRNVDFSNYKRTMNPQQWESILNADNPLQQFFQYWTIKESTIKADGRGLQMTLTKILIGEKCTRYEKKQWAYQVLPLGIHYCGAIAGNIPADRAKIRFIDWVDLWNYDL